MNKGVLLSKKLAERTKTVVEGFFPRAAPNIDPRAIAQIAGLIHPVELTKDWENDDDVPGWRARFRKLFFDPPTGEYHFCDVNEQEDFLYYPLDIGKPPGGKGSRAFAVYRGRWEAFAFGEGTSNAKELFPAVAYRRIEGGELETYIICPGGRDDNRSLKTVHVLHVEKRKVSTSTFGTLPMAMSNFGAVIAANAYGSPTLVCAPGEIESGTQYPTQRFDFVQNEWAKTDGEKSLIGCPAYVKNGEVIIAGGQSAYYVQSLQTRAATPQGGVAMYGHSVTPFWTIDAVTGAVSSRIPRRMESNTSTSQQTESSIVNNEKWFLKQNFTGIFLDRSQNGKSVEFVAVGGMEMLGYQANAVVTYTIDATYGPLVDCQNNPQRLYERCEIFPDTPLPLGECGAVRIGNRLVCIGGRYRDENGKFAFHKRPWSLNLENTAEGWRNDLFPELPTPRFNAALSDVVTVTENILDDDSNDTGETRNVDRVFLIGGRTEDGLTASIEALNLTDMKWETDWPGLDGKIPKQDEDE